MNRIRVIYITGYDRSGTTLLDRLLGQANDVYSAGELRYIWERGFRDNQLCGCGVSFNKCDVWRDITGTAFGDTNLSIYNNIESVLKIQTSIDRLRYIPFINIRRRSMLKFTEHLLYPLYKSILEVTRCKLIIDSSKFPSYLYILAKCNFIELYVIHLQRDSRAVAFSESKVKQRPEIIDKRIFMAKRSALSSAGRWLAFNLLIKLICKCAIPKDHYKLLSYEAMIESPCEVLRDLLSFIGLKDQLLFMKSRNIADLQINHTVAGNPMRFKTGLVELVMDDEWKTKLSKWNKWLVTIITYPLQKKVS